MKHPELSKLALVKAFILDVDGVLTDGTVCVTESGDEMRTMNIKDGYALSYASKQGYPIIVISGGRSEGVRIRLNRLGISEVHLKIQDKLPVLEESLKKHGLTLADCAYMGDDLPDLTAMKACLLSACPADAVWEVRDAAGFISQFKGGEGCVRELIEQCLKIQGKWAV